MTNAIFMLFYLLFLQKNYLATAEQRFKFPFSFSGEGSLETQPENDPHSENGHRNDDDQEVGSS